MRISISNVLNNRTLSCFLLILALTLALRVTRSLIDDRMDKDTVAYLWMAEAAASGDINGAVAYNNRIPPLYVSIMAAGEYLGLGAYLTGMAVSVIAGTILLIPVFWISKTLFNDKIGLFAALIVAAHPYLVRISAEVMRDSLYLCLIFTALAFAVKATRENSSLSWVVPGIFSGLAVMTRAEGIEMMAAVVIWFAVELFSSMKNGNFAVILKRRLKSLSCLVAAFLIVTLPVQLILSETTSTWGPVDYRIASFFRNFTKLSSLDVIEMEKRQN